MSSYEKPDFWAQKAKKEGYPARSVYKLMEIDKKFGLIKQEARVLDIGAAPRLMEPVGAPAPRGQGFPRRCRPSGTAHHARPTIFLFVRGDLYDAAVRARLLAAGPFSLVLSDAAPGTTGNRFVDQSASEAIVEAVIDYAEASLAPGGAFVAKIFQGGAEAALLKRLRGRSG